MNDYRLQIGFISLIHKRIHIELTKKQKIKLNYLEYNKDYSKFVNYFFFWGVTK